jgi:hypothetical protein
MLNHADAQQATPVVSQTVIGAAEGRVLEIGVGSGPAQNHRPTPQKLTLY